MKINKCIMHIRMMSQVYVPSLVSIRESVSRNVKCCWKTCQISVGQHSIFMFLGVCCVSVQASKKYIYLNAVWKGVPPWYWYVCWVAIDGLLFVFLWLLGADVLLISDVLHSLVAIYGNAISHHIVLMHTNVIHLWIMSQSMIWQLFGATATFFVIHRMKCKPMHFE